MALLAELPDLTILYLSNSLAGNRMAKELPYLSKLKYLNLNDTRVTVDALVDLGQITTLEGLSLEGIRITDSNLDQLTGLKNLKSLDLDNTRVTKEGRAKLRKALPHCVIDAER